MNTFPKDSSLLTAFLTAGTGFEANGDSDQVAYTDALAYVLSAYNTGVILMQQNADGTFTAIYSTSQTSGGTRTYSSTPCS